MINSVVVFIIKRILRLKGATYAIEPRSIEYIRQMMFKTNEGQEIRMIITVTMNPAIDKTAYVESLQPGGLNRLQDIILDPGGKGINVSKTIKELGGQTLACGFAGGSGGILLQKLLSEQGIHTDFVEIQRDIRTNLKLIDEEGRITELNEPGPVVTEAELESLIRKLIGYANEETVFVLAGSVPGGVSKDIYGRLTRILKEKGSKVIVDSDGELFVNTLDAAPDVIKPNRQELEEYFQLDYPADQAQIITLGRRLLEKGIGLVTISLGPQGAVFVTKERIMCCPGLKVEAHSTVGAGDAMTAALAYSIEQGLGLVEGLKLAVAVSAGAVTTRGTKAPNQQLVKTLLNQVEIQEYQ